MIWIYLYVFRSVFYASMRKIIEVEQISQSPAPTSEIVDKEVLGGAVLLVESVGSFGHAFELGFAL